MAWYEERARGNRITQRVASGEAITKVAADEGISRQRVSQIIHKHGLHIGEPRTVSRQRSVRESMVALARSGQTVEQIAQSLDRSTDSVRNSLRRVGILFGRTARSPQHGTAAEYNNRGCRCEPCRAANAARMRDYYKGQGRMKATQRYRSYVERYPDRRRAYAAVNAAVRTGQIVKPLRCGCGRNAVLHAHHDDYSKPLDVMWLCAVCHKARHQMMRQQKAA